MKIIVDGFGGDNAPLAVLEGCAAAVKEYGVSLIVTGDESLIKKTADEHQIPLDGIEIVHAPDVISMHDDPVSLLKAKSESSMAVGFKLLKEGKGDAFVSGGSTGAIVVGANFIVKRLKGIKRAGLATVIPTAKGCYLLMDAGANLDCKPETLLHFGLMGSIYMEKVIGRRCPRIGLVNVGEESKKGSALTKVTYEMLTESDLNFVGNVEAREVPKGACDVIVTDGFTGNVILKLTEGLAWNILQVIKRKFTEGIKAKMGAALLIDKLSGLKKEFDYSEYGGAPILGIKGPVVKMHGSSSANAVKNTILKGIPYVTENVVQTIELSVLEIEENTFSED